MEITLQILILIGLAGTIFYLYKTNSNKNSEEKPDDEALKMQQQLNNQLKDEIQQLREDKEYLTIANTKNATENSNLKEKLDSHKDETEKLQEKFTKEFENLANKIFEEKSTKFTHQNKENIQNILNPLKEKIDGFEKKVAESQKDSVGMHAALKEQLSGLKELNLQMSKEALNLTRALKGDSKVQGDWGETQLEMLLEKANLAKERLKMREESRVRKIIADLPQTLTKNIKLKTQSIFGKRGYSIGHYAEVVRADLLVMNAPLKTGLLDRIFPHDIEYILSDLPTDLLIIRNRD